MTVFSPPAAGSRVSASESRESRRTLKTATSSRSADASSKYTGGIYCASAAVRLDPMMPPSVAPAEMKPKSRFPCSALKRSTINAQKTETTKRLKIDVQIKNTRPTQIDCSAPKPFKSRKNKTRFAMKKRYVMEMKRARGSFATSAAKGGFTASMPSSVPVKSHGRFSMPDRKSTRLNSSHV